MKEEEEKKEDSKDEEVKKEDGQEAPKGETESEVKKEEPK